MAAVAFSDGRLPRTGLKKFLAQLLPYLSQCRVKLKLNSSPQKGLTVAMNFEIVAISRLKPGNRA